MSETKHTPSPWKVINGDLSNRKMHQIIGPICAKGEISLADVNLVSAAPDMYELLERISDCHVLPDKTIEEIRAALAKARGQK